MGLAASQARFLAITARKADCEFRSMQIAQNKLSVTRELQAATETYQNAMNAEMLVWDYDGMASDLQAVSYNIMTRPSVYNNYTPFLLTDRGGRVIVSPQIAAAAAAAGINPDKGGTRSEVNFNRFLNALVGSNVISQQTANEIHNATFGPDAVYTGLDGKTYQCKAKDAVPIYVSDTGTFLGTVYKTIPPADDSEYDWNEYYKGEINEAPEGSSIAYVVGPNHRVRDLYIIAQSLNGSYNGTIMSGYEDRYSSTGRGRSALDSSGKVQRDADGNPQYHSISGVPTQLTIEDIDKWWGVHLVKSNYGENNGYGAEPMSKNALKGLTLPQLAEAIKEHSITSAGQIIALNNVSLQDIVDDKDGDGIGKLVQANPANSGQKIEYNIKRNGTTYSGENLDIITLSDVLSGNVVMTAHHADGDHAYHDDFNGFLDEFLQASITEIGKALGAYQSNITDISQQSSYLDTNFGNIMYLAYEFTKAAFCSGASTVSSRKSGDTDTQKKAIDEAKETNHTIFYKNEGDKYNSTAAVSLTNMLDYFLTYVTLLEDGFDSDYSATDKVADSYFVTNDLSYRWVINDAATETNEAVMKSDFYQQLFNNLCINGYKTDQRITNDNDYLEQMLKNGSYFVSSLGHDGYFYQSRYNDAENTLIKVVADEDAIAVAESEYNYMKIKLTAKEDKLDLDMKNIDMEISALTTEYDSVKNLISKGIEKTFKQFEG